jgi:hypothetical protein
MVTTPRRCASCGEAIVIFSPANSIAPLSGCWAPERIFDERRLPGSVFAEEGVNFVAQDFQSGIAKRLDAWKAPADRRYA